MNRKISTPSLSKSGTSRPVTASRFRLSTTQGSLACFSSFQYRSNQIWGISSFSFGNLKTSITFAQYVIVGENSLGGYRGNVIMWEVRYHVGAVLLPGRYVITWCGCTPWEIRYNAPHLPAPPPQLCRPSSYLLPPLSHKPGGRTRPVSGLQQVRVRTQYILDKRTLWPYYILRTPPETPGEPDAVSLAAYTRHVHLLFLPQFMISRSASNKKNLTGPPLLPHSRQTGIAH